MFIRLKSLQRVSLARLNRGVGVGPCKDPLLEFHNGLGWLGVLPFEANDDVEVVAADAAELETLSTLTEYGPHYAADFETDSSRPLEVAAPLPSAASWTPRNRCFRSDRPL